MSAPVETAAAHNSNILAPDVLMVVLTWATFFILMAILKKFAWKPILENLKNREDYIRKSFEDADKAKEQLVQIEAQKTQILNEARQKAADIVDESRKSAASLAHDIENKAKLNAQEIVVNANAQIEGEREKVRQALRKESVEIAIGLAGKILKENSNTDKNRALIEAAVKDL